MNYCPNVHTERPTRKHQRYPGYQQSNRTEQLQDKLLFHCQQAVITQHSRGMLGPHYQL